jgi:indolepyruvate ferredoxin oxidoreductase
VQAIRAALAAGVNITYKILFNDAVAMTGGQPNEGGLTPQRIARELLAMGVGTVVAVHDPKEAPERGSFPPAVRLRPRDELDAVQREMQQMAGVSAIIYIQTCAAEKRRRRKRGAFPDPDRRVFINPDVCEGCGDCGVQSNCVAIVPLDTEFGRKRAIDQSACNKDFSCLAGFCPSFVTLEGAKVRRPAPGDFLLPELPEPQLPAIRGTWNLVVTGVGGTGVVTVGAVLAMAAHLEGRGAGLIEMTGLAQKGGAVQVHCRLAERPADISAIRVAAGEADAVIGGDLVVSAGARTLGLMAHGRTRAVVNAHEIVTGEFALDRGFRLPAERLTLALRARLGEGLALLDATRLAEKLLGDAIFANVLTLGAAWQAGLVPLSEAAILRAIELNGAAAEGNARAFALGRWAAAFPAEAAAAVPEPRPAEDLDAVVARRAEHLAKYQGPRLARRYRARIAAARVVDADFAMAMAKGYHKLLAYKDEYEVARLLAGTKAAVDAQFTGVRAVRFHLAPPFLGGERQAKHEFGPWVLRLFAVLRRFKGLRGTFLDPFGYSAERRLERALIADYERDMDEVQRAIGPATRAIAVELAALPLEIRGFGHVKAGAAAAAAGRRAELIAALAPASRPQMRAAE